MAGIGPGDVDVLQALRLVHHHRAAAPRGPRLLRQGRGWRVRRGRQARARRRAARRTRTAAGSSYTHPGQYGMFLLVEAVRQLRGECRRRVRSTARDGRGRARVRRRALGDRHGRARARRRPCDRLASSRRSPTRPSPFWDATRERRFAAAVVHGVRAPVLVPAGTCPRCLGSAIEWRDTAGLGAVHAVSVQHRPGTGRRRRRRVRTSVALVDLDEGVRMMTNVVGCRTDHVAVGTAGARSRGSPCPTAGTSRCSGPAIRLTRCRSPTSPPPSPSCCTTAAARFGDARPASSPTASG